ncbi:Protein DEFECTIVE IN EXINE FORMATION 1 [Vigna angularis]|uniref:Protein DEFECTIVE IN EXINE FORMATION 1 n=1 Tax=Phaseolus angularis TaxID=3914 RepID=A0A8T0LCA5_PHAAN|nr:Protein DEFECTIVE IN EXINE FORMATION 1 [Vigna angularis]
MYALLFCNDGKLEVVISSFVHYLEVLEGVDRDKMSGPRVEIGDLADFINASQLEDEIDSLQDLPKNKHVASVDIQIEVR